MKQREIEGNFADISKRLRAYRDAIGLASKDYATAANINPKSYSQWESGQNRISIDGAINLSRTYNISLDYIYLGEMGTLNSDLIAAVASSRWLSG